MNMKNNNSKFIIASLIWILFTGCKQASPEKELVDYVNPYIGNISHMLVPTYPTVHLPNSMLRVYPQRNDYTGNQLKGLPVLLTAHRGIHAFNLSPDQGAESGLQPIISYNYDNEDIKPYYYNVYLDNINANVRFAPSHQSAIYNINFYQPDSNYLVINTNKGRLTAKGNSISGYQQIGNAKAYLYLETEQQPTTTYALSDGKIKNISEKDNCIVFHFADARQINIRYGVSFISEEQAKNNLIREIPDYNIDKIIEQGRNIWNEALGKIKVKGSDENQKTIFYTSMYRVYERPICISEDGHYYSGFDGKIHDDGGTPFYTDDWLWDTFRAAHPLRIIIDPQKENEILNSFIRMAEQRDNYWTPTFPEIGGDNHSMNCNHGVACFLDAYIKGIKNFDLNKAYKACKGAITEKTLIPWSAEKAGILDKFYKENGYFPSLAIGEKETVAEVNSFEKRQAVAVTLGTVYDEWCLAQIAKQLGNNEDYRYFLNRSLNYHKIFNPQTRFFHPKDSKGYFIEPFDYGLSGGIGFREYYDENNGWIYRWDLQHNFADLVKMIGGKKQFVAELERMYNTQLVLWKPDFFATNADHTGNVGQFSMGNEPCLHIPYLYNYAGEPWRTQYRIRHLMNQWFRNDVMGIPGDEDGGGMSAFGVFSSLGFYPITPGLPMYVIGSPIFENTQIQLNNGKVFKIICKNYAPENKYIQSARLNGQEWNKSWFTHTDLINGGTLELTMGKLPNKKWASTTEAIPPSFEMP